MSTERGPRAERDPAAATVSARPDRPGTGEPIRWLAGDPGVCEALSQAWRDAAAAGAARTELRDRPERRRLLRFRWPDGRDLFVKQFYMGGRRHRVRKRLVRLLRLEAARREWRAMLRLARAGVPAPTPRALGVLPGGDRILVVDFLAGQALDAALARDDAAPGAARLDRAELASSLGRLVAALHAQGIVHRDLHHGNVFLAEKGPLLLDLQLARPGRSRRARLRDIGQLETSLESALSLAQRVRLRAAALGLSRPFAAGARQLLREAGAAAVERRQRQAASRSRRALRPGRRFARASHAGARGLRLRELEAGDLADALAADLERGGELLHNDERCRVTAVEADGRRVVVKRFAAGGAGAALAVLVRGSPARRAWLAGFALEAHGILAVRPLAFLEERRLGLPRRSTLVMEDLRPARPATELAAGRAAEGIGVLLDLLGRLHARGILHEDLRADRVWLSGEGGACVARLSGLEDVRFPGRLTEAQRRRDLAQLNATLPDRADAALRCRAFSRYALLHPFSGDREAALEAIVRESLASGSRWQGTGCRVAAGIRSGPRP